MMSETPGAEVKKEGRLRSMDLFLKRQARWGALSGTGVLLLAAGLILLNLLAQKVSFRWDWTQGGRYSLSKASRRLVRGLPDPVLIRAYLSADFPPEYAAQAKYVADLLGEYRAAGKGKVKVEIKDPESSQKIKEDARRAGIQPVRITQMASDQFQVREGYLGVALFYQDKQESLPFVKDAGGLEYDLSTRIRKMAGTKKKVLGIVEGHGETDLNSLRSGGGAKIFDALDVRPVTLTASTPPSADALLVLNPSSAYSAGDLDALDAAVSSGTPTIFFLSRSSIDLQSFRSQPLQTGLEGLLEHFGVREEEGFVLDAQCQQVSIQSRQAGYMISNIINYPPFVLSRPDRNHPLTRSLDSLSFAFTHPLTLTGGAGITVTPLAHSSAYSWISSPMTALDPFSMRPPSKGSMSGPYVLAALVEGSTVSYRDPSREARVRLAVVGTGHFLDSDLPQAPGNGDFLSALAEWMVQDDDFLSIPTHGEAFRPLRPSSVWVRSAVKSAGYFLPPALMVVWGFLGWRRRRRLRPVIQKAWESARG